MFLASLAGVRRPTTLVMQSTRSGAANRAPSSRPAVAPLVRRRRRYGLALAAAAALACGGGDGGSSGPGGPVAEVAVDPAQVTVVVGKTTRLGVVMHDESGNLLRGRPVFWESSNPAIASVSQDGVVNGKQPGAAKVAANAEGKTGYADVTVSPGGPASVTVDPRSATVLVGQTAQFRATVRDAFGGELAGAVGWSSDNSSVARVSGDGVVTGVSPGSATITASREGVSGNATVTVQLVPVARVVVSPSSASIKKGQTRQFSASAFDAQGHVLTGRPVAWSSSDTKVATISNAGVATGKSGGTATITATVAGIGGTATLIVR